jgi:2-polyprenyl-3-methyl-5-hydroxy-6-metoxy-1,4-benzoquinol methylase
MNCPICGGPSTLDERHPQVKLGRCTRCDHRFSRIRPGVPMEPYDAPYFEKTHRNWFAQPNLPLFEKIARLIEREPAPASLVDVGCGNGDLLRFLASRPTSAVTLTGVDLVANPPRSGIEFIRGDIFALDIGRQFSIVISLMTIEHIADIRAFVRRLKSLARPGGLVVINTINDDSTLYEAARILRRFGVALPFDRLYSRHHLHHFSRGSLSHLLENDELQVTDVILRNAPLASLDIPVSSRAAALMLLGGVSLLFALGSIFGRTYSQTVICRREAIP